MKPGSYIIITARVFKEQGQFAAICDELGLASCGEDEQDARTHLETAMSLVLNEATKRQEIKALLKEKGIKIYSPEEPRRIYFEKFSLNIGEGLHPVQMPLGGHALAV